MTHCVDILRSFGKIGILVDDAPLATFRVARELYGADVLPRWWIHVRTVQEAVDELRAFATADDRTLPAMVVVDRLLPASATEPPLYWENASGPPCDEFRTLLQQLRDREPALTQIVPITSYPRRDPALSSSIEWKPRFHEPLFQLRRSMVRKDSLLKPLLRYWSEAQPPNASADEGTRSWHLAQHGRRLIDQTAARLNDPTNWQVVLLTGAGMSIAEDSHCAGIPKNDVLLTEAARSTTDITGATGKLLALLRQYTRDKSVCLEKIANERWNFNELFSDDPEAELDPVERRFRKNFQRAVMRYDVGICYQHWLAAGLPFDVIVSTNFDGFHERAAAHWAATHGTDENLKIAEIIKPYGTAAQRGPIAFSEKQFRNGVARISSALAEAIRRKPQRRLQLVVVGYACRDADIPTALSSVLDAWQGEGGAAYQLSLLWVVPEAYDVLRGSAPFPSEFRHYRDRLFSDSLGNKIHQALPVRAIDFFYDLWSRFMELQAASVQRSHGPP